MWFQVCENASCVVSYKMSKVHYRYGNFRPVVYLTLLVTSQHNINTHSTRRVLMAYSNISVEIRGVVGEAISRKAQYQWQEITA